MPSLPCRDHTVARQETTSAGGEEVPWQSLTIARESVPDVRDQIIGYLLTQPLLTRCGGFAWWPLRRYRRAPSERMHDRDKNVNARNTKPSEGHPEGFMRAVSPWDSRPRSKYPFGRARRGAYRRADPVSTSFRGREQTARQSNQQWPREIPTASDVRQTQPETETAMGREIMRVPMDFNFPLDKSYSQTMFSEHCEKCRRKSHNRCKYARRPPTGEGWQLWQTVSDGPISPVFETADMLIGWMSKPVPLADRKPWRPEAYPPNPWAQGWNPTTAERFVNGSGWMPSGIIENGRVLSTTETVEVLQR